MRARPEFYELRHGTRYLHASAVGTVGATRCDQDHRDFHRPGPIEAHVFVYPSTSVWVERDREPSFLADANVMTFHHEGDEIRRLSEDGRGDHCNWFAVNYDLLLPAVEARGGGARGRFGGPFPARQARAGRGMYLRQAMLVRELLMGGPPAEALRVDETLLALMGEVLDGLFGSDLTPEKRGETQRRHRELVERTKAWFGQFYRRDVSLTEVAAAVDSSPFHLARVFRRQTGRSLHEYRHQLRLRAALAAVLDGESDLAQLALRLGFSSHSHLTDSFRKCFGLPPSRLRPRSRGVRLG